MQQQERPHTGRRRNEATRRAICDAVLAMLADPERTSFTMDSVAAAAGAGKQTIYRWWPSKALLLAEVMGKRAALEVPAPRTGSLLSDLTAFLSATSRAARDRSVSQALRMIMAEAQSDQQAARVLATYTGGRRKALQDVFRSAIERSEIDPRTDIDTLVDQAFGFIWYRLLVGHAPFDSRAATQLATGLAAQATISYIEAKAADRRS